VSGEGAFARETFWWEVLDAAMRAGEIEGARAREMHARFRSATPEERERILETLPPVAGPFPLRMTRDEISALPGEGPFEVGGHGWSHRDLGTLPAEEQRREIERNLSDLAALTGAEIVSFAYPFGGPFTTETVAILRRSGVEVACTVADQPVTPHTDRFSVPRVEVRDWTGEELIRRLERILEGGSLPDAREGETRRATP
jgi:peptidoglycan/xylan/chitin deacetylase (PgdA/CDA1 family)